VCCKGEGEMEIIHVFVVYALIIKYNWFQIKYNYLDLFSISLSKTNNTEFLSGSE